MVSRSATSNGRHYYISRSEEFNNESAPAQSCDHQHQQQGGLHPTNVVASQTEESTLVEGIIDLTPRLELKVSAHPSCTVSDHLHTLFSFSFFNARTLKC